MDFELEIRIGDHVFDFVVPGEIDGSLAYAMVSLSEEDIARFHYPGARIEVNSKNSSDRVEVLARRIRQRPFDGEEKITGEYEIPTDFDVVRRLN